MHISELQEVLLKQTYSNLICFFIFICHNQCLWQHHLINWLIFQPRWAANYFLSFSAEICLTGAFRRVAMPEPFYGTIQSVHQIQQWWGKLQVFLILSSVRCSILIPPGYHPIHPDHPLIAPRCFIRLWRVIHFRLVTVVLPNEISLW